MIGHRSGDITSNALDNLTVSEEFPNCVTVEYSPSQQDIESWYLPEEEKQRALSLKHQLLMINGQDDYISIYPINTLPTHINFLHQKYDQIESITLEGFGFSTPQNTDELLDLFESFPTGFIKNHEYGLGLLKEYRFIVHTLEKIPKLRHLAISHNNATSLNGDLFTLNFQDFETIRKGINRIASKHQKDSLIEKNIFAYNSILHQIDPTKFEEKKKDYKKDTIFKFITSTNLESSSLSKVDAESIIRVLSTDKNAIYKQKRKEILQLQEDIELINLEYLINETEKLLSINANESKWQTFFNNNPLLLSLAFGYPVIKIKDQASVGGRKLSGSGDKITDFLIKNNLTNNTALIEIKKPKTKILQKTEYRTGVYAPSSELTGSVNQILDQKYKFQQEISNIKCNTRIYDIETYAVDCVLIIGRIPTIEEKKKSFELYRQNLKDVRIITFDELTTKLKEIHIALKQNPIIEQ